MLVCVFVRCMQAFGVPTMVFNDKTGKQQMIFGSDRMHIIADLLGTKYDGPLANLGTAVWRPFLAYLQ